MLVIVDMWSKWVEAFPSKKADTSAVVKALLQHIIPLFGCPKKISSDNASHFTSDACKQIGKYLGINMTTHCAYYPQAAGAIERQNAILKQKLQKITAETGIPWTKALPIALMHMRMRERSRLNLSPFEIMFGRPPYTGIGPPSAPLPDSTCCDDAMLQYCKTMSSALSQIRRQVTDALPQEAKGPLHDIQPGDYVLIKDFRRSRWNSERWRGPFLVLLVTFTSVKVAERSTWVHSSHCKLHKGPFPEKEPDSHTQQFPPGSSSPTQQPQQPLEDGHSQQAQPLEQRRSARLADKRYQNQNPQ